MRKNFLACLFASLSVSLSAQGAKGPVPDPLAVAKSIKWYGQDDLRIELGGKVIRIDPAISRTKEKADIILLTHDHSDHFMSSRVKTLTGKSTRVLAGFDGPDYLRMEPGDEIEIGELTIEAVPAYNTGSNNHPKAARYCGFVIYGDGINVYVSGDTNRIPEMTKIRCDIALLPLGQTYTMSSVDEAVQAALDVKAKVAIPVHYGIYEGAEADADKFVSDLKAKGVEAFKLQKSK